MQLVLCHNLMEASCFLFTKMLSEDISSEYFLVVVISRK